MATTTTKRRSSSFLKEGLLLPIRNVRLFILPILLTIAYVAARVVSYTAMEPLFHDVVVDFKTLLSINPRDPGYAELAGKILTRAYQFIAASAAYHVVTAFAVGPAVMAVTVSACVAACRASVLRERASLKGTVLGTAVLCSALHVVCQSAIHVMRMYIKFYRRDPSPARLSMEILLLFFLSYGVKHCLQLVGTVAIVMSAAEPAGCFRGVRAFRQAWWLVAGDSAPAVVLVAGSCAAKAGLWLLKTVLPGIHFFHGMAGAAFTEFIYEVLSAALHLWFVCATTVYYFRRRHRNYGDGPI